jgi:hypothetical protein
MRTSVVILATLLPLSALGSATENEFEPCKKLAVATLSACLQEQSANTTTIGQCWVDSQQQFSSCRQRVLDSHNPDLQRQQREAREKAERAEQLRKQKTDQIN